MIQERLYGPQGFTTRGKLGELLARYEGNMWGFPASDVGGIVQLDAIPPEALREICDLLPEDNREDRQNDSPSLAQFAAMETPGIHFHGYRVVPKREDERVSIEGFYCPPEYSKIALAQCPKPPNEAGVVDHLKLGKVFRAWWD